MDRFLVSLVLFPRSLSQCTSSTFTHLSVYGNKLLNNYRSKLKSKLYFISIDQTDEYVPNFISILVSIPVNKKIILRVQNIVRKNACIISGICTR